MTGYANAIIFKNNIITIENQILSSQLTIEEKLPLLVGATVARHSAYYWMTKPIAEIRNNLNDQDFESIKVIDILKSDFQGAVVGGISGLVKGLASGSLVFGPGGVVLTAVGGAVIGAVVGSFGDLLWSLFWEGLDWLCT